MTAVIKGPIAGEDAPPDIIAVLKEFAGATGWSSAKGIAMVIAGRGVGNSPSVLLHTTLSPDLIVNGLGANAQVPL